MNFNIPEREGDPEKEGSESEDLEDKSEKTKKELLSDKSVEELKEMAEEKNLSGALDGRNSYTSVIEDNYEKSEIREWEADVIDSSEKDDNQKMKFNIPGSKTPKAEDTSVSEAMNEMRDMMEEVKGSRGRIGELEEELRNEKEKRIPAENRIESLESELEEAKSELEDLQGINKKHKQLQSEYEELKREKEELEDTYAKKDLESLKEQLYAVNGLLDRLDEDNSEKREELLEKKEKISEKKLILKDFLE